MAIVVDVILVNIKIIIIPHKDTNNNIIKNIISMYIVKCIHYYNIFLINNDYYRCWEQYNYY